MLQLRRPLPPPPSFMMQHSSPSVAAPMVTPPALTPSQRHIHHMLSRYISTIRREDYLPRLNEALRACTSSAGHAAADIQSYYAARPELRKYTLGVELDRDLDYTLVLEDGEAVTDKHAIRSYFGADSDGQQAAQARAHEGAISTEELLIRAANQSLLADALVALSGQEDVLENRAQIHEAKMGLILSGPLLSMTSVVEKCHFTVDLQRKRVEAICVLAISVPIEHRRLVLARAILMVNFRPGKKRQMQYFLQMVKAHHYPLSKTLHDAAISLAKDQDSLSVQSDHTNTEKEDSNKLQRLFAFR